MESAKKMAPNYGEPDSSTRLVYRPLQAPHLIPKDVNGWAIQVGHKGVRLSIKDEYGPLARWRINLPDRYSYLVLPRNPDIMKDSPEMKDWTDSMFIDELQKEQAKGNVNTGLIPASVFNAAIEHYSSNSLHNAIRAKDEEDRVDINVERFALRHMFTDPKAIRESIVLVLGGSGSFIYKSSSHSIVDQFLRGNEDGDWEAVKFRRPNLQGSMAVEQVGLTGLKV